MGSWPPLGSSGAWSYRNSEVLKFSFYPVRYLYCPLSLNIHIVVGHTVLESYPEMFFFSWFAMLTFGRTDLSFGNGLLVFSPSGGLCVCWGICCACCGSCHKRCKSLGHTDWKGASQEASRFPRAWASFLAHPQEMNSSCFAFLNFLPLPSPLSGWAPNPSLVWLTPKPYNISGGKHHCQKGGIQGLGSWKQRGSLSSEPCSVGLSTLV